MTKSAPQRMPGRVRTIGIAVTTIGTFRMLAKAMAITMAQTPLIVTHISLNAIRAGIDQISKTDAIITQSSMSTASVSAPKLARAQNRPIAGIPNAAFKPAEQGWVMRGVFIKGLVERFRTG